MLKNIDLFVNNLSEIVGQPQDKLRLLLTIIVSVFICHLLKNLQQPIIRKIFNLVLGISFQYFVFREKSIYVLAQSIFYYLCLMIFGRKACMFLFFQVLVLALSMSLYNQVYYWGVYEIDVRLIFMVNVQKFQSFAFCYLDGKKIKEQLSEYQIQHRIQELPSLIDFLGFIYFLPTCIIGPGLEYIDFINFIELNDSFQNIPSTIYESSKWFVQGIFFIIINSILVPLFPLDYIISDEFAQKSWIEQFFLINITGYVQRTTYYVAWSIAQSSLSGCGISYQETSKDNVVQWNRIVTCYPEQELLYNPVIKMQLWNRQTQIWLKNYIYFRWYSQKEQAQDVKNQNISAHITFMYSAFWHGFYPGVLICFVHASIIQYISKAFYKISLNRFPENFDYRNPVYQFFRYLIPNTFMNYIYLGFELMAFSYTLKLQQSTNYFYEIVLYSSFLFIVLTGFGQRSSKPKEKKSQ